MRACHFALLLSPLFPLTCAQAQSPAIVNGIESIPNKPFVARCVYTLTHAAPSGVAATDVVTLRAARDSQGRIYAESPRHLPHRLTASRPLVYLYNPTARAAYLLDPADHTAQPTPADSSASGCPQIPTSTESLGARLLDHLTVQGTRTTCTLSPGEAGTTAPVVVTEERWYSPSLHLFVLTRSNDPHTGETTRHFIRIRAIEPPPTLFLLPKRYLASPGP
jgi:hypothetical protein